MTRRLSLVLAPCLALVDEATEVSESGLAIRVTRRRGAPLFACENEGPPGKAARLRDDHSADVADVILERDPTRKIKKKGFVRKKSFEVKAERNERANGLQ